MNQSVQRILSEDAISLADAQAELKPFLNKRPDKSTVVRWCKKGVGRRVSGTRPHREPNHHEPPSTDSFHRATHSGDRLKTKTAPCAGHCTQGRSGLSQQHEGTESIMTYQPPFGNHFSCPVHSASTNTRPRRSWNILGQQFAAVGLSLFLADRRGTSAADQWQDARTLAIPHARVVTIECSDWRASR